MKLVIKSSPEDFCVEEIADLPLRKKGDFGIYRLEKEHWNTVGVIFEISKRTGIPFKNFSYGGKKDRHALTRQYISIKGTRLDNIKEADYSLDFLGFLDRPMGPDLIEANSFKVVVRKLTKEALSQALAQISSIERFGFTNYFDDQRFGSFNIDKGFLAEKLLLNHLSGALKIYMTAVNTTDPAQEKERKVKIWKNWGDWKACRTYAKSVFEKNAFEFLIKKPKDFLFLLKEIPREKLSIYFSAYQSFVWNEIARTLIREKVTQPLKPYPGIVGDYIFFNSLSDMEEAYLKDLKIPMLAAKAKMPDNLCVEIADKILQERGIKRPMFNRLKVRQAFFKPTERSLIGKPQNLSFDESDDELHPHKKKLSLCFKLGRGSFATMFLKRLFCF